MRAAKRLTLDTLGCALAASALDPGSRIARDVVDALGGMQSPTGAAFAYGALASALNYDAAGVDVGHPGTVSLAVPLALAKTRGPVAGKRYLTAVVLAAEITSRLALASSSARHLGSERRLLLGQYFGYFGAAAAAGSILDLSAAAMQSAFGLALMQVAGTRQVIVEGDPPAKAIFGAFPNHGGMLAALLAEAGLGAEIDALEGAAGFFALVGGEIDRAMVGSELGRRYRLLDITFKAWPTSGVIAPFIEAAIALAIEHDLRSETIAAVEAIGSSQLRQWCEPLAERRYPSNGTAAANSIPFATAVALAHRRVDLGAFTSAGLEDEATRAIAARTTFYADDAVRGGAVRVRTVDGREPFAQVQTPLGAPSRPLTNKQLRSKFSSNCRFAHADAAALNAFIDRLELAGDASPVWP